MVGTSLHGSLAQQLVMMGGSGLESGGGGGSVTANLTVGDLLTDAAFSGQATGFKTEQINFKSAVGARGGTITGEVGDVDNSVSPSVTNNKLSFAVGQHNWLTAQAAPSGADTAIELGVSAAKGSTTPIEVQSATVVNDKLTLRVNGTGMWPTLVFDANPALANDDAAILYYDQTVGGVTVRKLQLRARNHVFLSLDHDGTNASIALNSPISTPLTLTGEYIFMQPVQTDANRTTAQNEVDDRNRIVSITPDSRPADVGNIDLHQMEFRLGNDPTNSAITIYRRSSGSVASAAANVTYIDFRGTVRQNGVNIGETSLSSDDRLKHNETPITGALATIQQLSPQTYDMAQTLDDPTNTHREAGFIAQEVQQIPELAQFVIEGSETEIWRLRYDSLFTYSVAAIKELATTVASLEARLAALEAPRRRTSRTAAATTSAGAPEPPAPSQP